MGQELDTAHARHPLVRDHHLHVFTLENLERFRGRAGSQNSVGSAFESRRERKRRVVVVHQEDPEPHRHLKVETRGSAREQKQRTLRLRGPVVVGRRRTPVHQKSEPVRQKYGWVVRQGYGGARLRANSGHKESVSHTR